MSLDADSRYQLTGEAAGRQIWHQEAPGVHEHAHAHDKTFCFNASENPNSSDQLFRDQMLQKWARTGKEVPDCDSIPSSARDAAVKGLQFYQMIQCDDGHWAGDYGGECAISNAVSMFSFN